MKRLLFAAAATTSLLLGCRSQPLALTAVERTAVEAEIAAARDAYFDAATRLDADALVAFWGRDFIHVSNDRVMPLTVEGLRAAWEPLSHMNLDITSEHVIALSRDAGVTVLTASYTVFDRAGVAVAGNDWAGTHVWSRSEEGWRVQAVHEGRPTRDG